MVPGNSNGTAARYREHFAYRAGPLCGGVGCPTEISKERASKVGRPNERAMSELGHERRGRAHKPEPRRPQCADCVEKLICASGRERLIQDQAPTRNNDSRTDPPGFLYCKFCFHSARSASFSTQSAKSRHLSLDASQQRGKPGWTGSRNACALHASPGPARHGWMTPMEPFGFGVAGLRAREVRFRRPR